MSPAVLRTEMPSQKDRLGLGFVIAGDYTPGPVFTKILILRISLILRIFLRIVIFLRKILRIGIFLFTKNSYS